MTLGTILIIILILILIGALPSWGYSRSWGYGPSGILGLIVLQVVLGVSQDDVPLLGLLHGPNALLILVVAILAARRAKDLDAPVVPQPA